MDNPNNNNDPIAEAEALYPVLKPAPDMTREEFVQQMQNRLQELTEDHEEQTGTSDSELHDWNYWIEQVTNAYINN